MSGSSEVPKPSDESKPAAYLILSSEDSRARDFRLSDDPLRALGHGQAERGRSSSRSTNERSRSGFGSCRRSFPKEYQLSGRRWTPTIQTHDRISGKLQFTYANTGDEADLELDATLLKEFPVKPSHH